MKDETTKKSANKNGDIMAFFSQNKDVQVDADGCPLSLAAADIEKAMFFPADQASGGDSAQKTSHTDSKRGDISDAEHAGEKPDFSSPSGKRQPRPAKSMKHMGRDRKKMVEIFKSTYPELVDGNNHIKYPIEDSLLRIAPALHG